MRLRRRANNDALKHDVTYVSTSAIAALTACLADYAGSDRRVADILRVVNDKTRKYG